MTLVITARGTGATNTGGQTTHAISPASNCTPGAMVVACFAYDNSGTNGADPRNGVTDSLGNTWGTNVASLNDPGAANAGIVLSIFSTTQGKAPIVTGTVITLDFGGIVTVARAYAIWEVAGGGVLSVRDTYQGTATTATPSLGTSTILLGEVTCCAVGIQGNDVLTGDADTSNGTWTAQQTTGVGTTTSGASITSQCKLATADAAQTYNPTSTTSRVLATGGITIAEAYRVTPRPYPQLLPQ